jgi:hypothetical protein
MESSNFIPLKSRWPDLYDHARLAERYAYSDPHSATIKLRCFAEALVGIIYRDLELTGAPGDKFIDRLNAPAFSNLIDQAVLEKLHAIRMHGNKAAHGALLDSRISLRLIEEAYLVGQWFLKTYGGAPTDGYPVYTPPPPIEESTHSKEALERQLAEALEQLTGLAASEQAAVARVASLDPRPDSVHTWDFKYRAIDAAKSIDLRQDRTRDLLKIQDAFSEFELNVGQAALVERLDSFLHSESERVFLLKGYAGTGKTFITKGLTEYFRAIGRNYVLAAPTGKAAKVIATKTRSPACTIHKTVYSFDDIVEYRDDGEEGTETYKFYANLRVNEHSVDTVYIVDEASMFSDVYQEAEFVRFGTGYLLRDFLEFVNLDHNDHRKKLILIGDNAQLPPVGMNFSPALDADYLSRRYALRTTEFELTEVVRQKAESGVIANALPLRTALRGKTFNRLSMDFGYPDVKEVAHADLMARYLDACGHQINESAIVIAHTNADVADYNCRIREHFFPGCEHMMTGDTVMAVSNSNACGIFISNGDFGVVRHVSDRQVSRTITLRRKTSDPKVVEEIPVPLVFRDAQIEFKDIDGAKRVVSATFLEDLLYSKAPTLSSDQNKALYQDFCIRNKGLRRGSDEFKRTLLSDPYFNAFRLKFGYAITCHKAQGSEWDHVFVKCKSHQSQLTAEYFRWLYTAITRTAGSLYLLDPPRHTPWSSIAVVGDPRGAMLGGAGAEAGAEKAELEVSAGIALPLQAQPDSPVATADGPDAFGIPTSAPFLRALLARIRKLLDGRDVAIEGIQHDQYQEAYSFSRAGEIARVNVVYNAKGKVGTVVAPKLTEFAAEVVSILAPLKGVAIAPDAAETAEETRFSQPFLDEFHRGVLARCNDSGIVVRRVVEQQWALRYTFVRGAEVAVYDVWYNSKARFSKCAPLATGCSPGLLVGQVGLLLTDGMKA